LSIVPRPKYISPDDFLKYHQDNFYAIDATIKEVDKMLDRAISKNEDDIIQPFIRLYGLLLGVWAECRLNKLLYEKGGFNETHRKTIRSGDTIFEQWQICVEIAFCENYKPEDLFKLSFSARTKLDAILTMLEEDLKPIIEIRNKLAHGQWIYPFNNGLTQIEDKKRKILIDENFLTLKYKIQLISKIASIINSLVISKSEFEENFDDNYERIEHIKTKLEKYKKLNNYSHYVKKRQEDYEKHKKRGDFFIPAFCESGYSEIKTAQIV